MCRTLPTLLAFRERNAERIIGHIAYLLEKLSKKEWARIMCVCVWGGGSSRVSAGEQVEKLTPTVSEIVTSSTVTIY